MSEHKSTTPTPHIAAQKGEIARTVLMPGDPLRSKMIAETFLDGAKLVNNVRGVQGYTGTYNDVPVTVMASGMGMPSMGIYSYELFNFYDVENIIRVGTAGSFHENVKVRDVVLAEGACTDSNFGAQFMLPGTFAPIASYKLLSLAVAESKRLGARYHVGNVVSSDRFYNDVENSLDWAKMGVLAVEMEAAALYMNAARAGKHALAICTISDHLVTGEDTTVEERQSSFMTMMKIALGVAAADSTQV